MSYAVSQSDTLDYALCRYGASKLDFRGPKKDTSGSYIAVFGGTDTYGRFVPHPFSDVLETHVSGPVLNLGYPNAGIDAFLYDPDILTVAKAARLTVVQVMGAPNMSNRFYRVHPRRNDRFLGPSDMLKALFREVDFTDFSFTRHMLSALQMISEDRFGLVRDELQAAWLARMRLLLQTIDGPVLLLWLCDQVQDGLGREPLFVGADMVSDIAERCAGVVEVPIRRAGHDLEGMVFSPMQRGLAGKMLNTETHIEIADRLARQVRDFTTSA